MTLNEYQGAALITAKYPKTTGIEYTTLGLTGEAGEIANKVKKVLRDSNGVFTTDTKADLMKEAGDCLWYVAALASELGYSLEELAQVNIEKLHGRLARGTISGSGDNR